ncbi:MAG TPA: heavy metal-responsive transcriptional regulator [Pyrinomonadaceae bacterium]|nr:heavy metal-responsive transcriptional regulator [Pyrinomonadaceae bacterium]
MFLLVKQLEVKKMALRSKQQERVASSAPLKIGEVAKLSGIGIEALRFYERSGLLGQPARAQSGYRLYEAEVLERLDFIKRAQVLGFSLDEIKQIVAEKQSGHSPCEAVRDVVRTRLQELDVHMKEMRRYRNDLAATLAEWDKTGAVEGHICGFIEGSNLKHHLASMKVRPRLQKKR